jgi:hypothetical protein
MKKENQLFKLIILIVTLSSFSKKIINENKLTDITVERINYYSDKSLTQLLDYFRTNGFDGQKRPKGFALIGAQDGCAYSGRNFSIEIYKYDDISKMPSTFKYRNAHFGMIIHKGDESQIRKIFNSF